MKIKFLSIFCLLLFTSCASKIPTSKYKFGNLSIELPKDMTAKKLLIRFDSTNGFTLSADLISSANNPQVIEASGAANVDIIKAHYDGASILIDKAAQGASKAIVP